MGLCKKPVKASCVADAKGGDEKVGAVVKTCPLQQGNLTKVEWVNGGATGSEATIASGVQYVNLPHDEKWVNNDEITTVDRLGMNPRIKVTFDKPGAHKFWIKLLAPTGTPAYSDDEKTRNADFKYTETEKSFTTDADGTKIISGLKLVAGGGYKFKAKARDEKGATKQTGDLETKRLIYYAEAKMAGLTSIVDSTADVETEFAKHHMIFKKLGDLSIAHQKNIGTRADTSTMGANVNAAVDASADHKAKKKHMLIVAYTDHLAVKNSNVELKKVAVPAGPGKAKAVIAVIAAGLRAPNAIDERGLWHDIVTGEGWFVSAKFHPDDGTPVHDIAEGKLTPKGRTNYWNQIEVDVTGLPNKTGTIRLKVDVVDRMRGGLALGGANQTCVCTKAWWNTRSDPSQLRTVIHEIGHKVGQVADGSGIAPDKPAKHYINKGHVGNHCHQGVGAAVPRYNTTAARNSSTCVMFGTGNGHFGFCVDCAPCVKKVDLTAGW